MSANRRDRLRQLALSPTTRGSLMFLAGLGLTIREALNRGPERPSLYVLYAGMMGFPLVWASKDDQPPSPPPAPAATP